MKMWIKLKPNLNNRNKGFVNNSTKKMRDFFQIIERTTKNLKMKKKWEEGEGKLSAIYAGNNYRGGETVQWQHNWSKQIMVKYFIHRLYNNHSFAQVHIAFILKNYD